MSWTYIWRENDNTGNRMEPMYINHASSCSLQEGRNFMVSKVSTLGLGCETLGFEKKFWCLLFIF